MLCIMYIVFSCMLYILVYSFASATVTYIHIYINLHTYDYRINIKDVMAGQQWISGRLSVNQFDQLDTDLQ